MIMTMMEKGKYLRAMEIGGCYLFGSRKDHRIRMKIKEEEKAKEEQKPQASHPYFGYQTLAEKWRIPHIAQMLPLLGLSTYLMINESILYLSTPQHCLFALQKITFLSTMLNIKYPNNQSQRVSLISSVVLLNLFLPLTNPYSLIIQIYQLGLLAVTDTTKLDEKLEIKDEQVEIIRNRMKIKLILLTSGIACFLFKVLYHYRCFEMDKKLNQMNSANKMGSSVTKQINEILNE